MRRTIIMDNNRKIKTRSSTKAYKKISHWPFGLLGVTLLYVLFSNWAHGETIPPEAPPADCDQRDNPFVRREGRFLMLRCERYFFNGYNAYYIFALPPVADAVLQAGKDLGLNTVRVHSFNDGIRYNALQIAPGVYDEEVFQKFDYVLSLAAEYEQKVVMTLVNYWETWGGMDQYVAWSSTASIREDFYTDEQCKSMYRNHLWQMVHRVNTYTNVRYRDDPTIFAWQLTNEGRSKLGNGILKNWVDEMSEYLKSIDSNHLVGSGTEGFFDRDSPYKDAALGQWAQDLGSDFVKDNSGPYIDFASFHNYPDSWAPWTWTCPVPPGCGEWSEQEKLDFSLRWTNSHIQAGMEVLNKPVLMTEFGKWPYWGIHYRDNMFSQIYTDTFSAERGTWLTDIQGGSYSFTTIPGADYGPISVGTAFWDLVPIEVCAAMGACNQDSRYSVYPHDGFHATTRDIIAAHSEDVKNFSILPGQAPEHHEPEPQPFPPSEDDKYEIIWLAEITVVEDGRLGEKFEPNEFDSSWNIWIEMAETLSIYMGAWGAFGVQSNSAISAADYTPEGSAVNSTSIELELFIRWASVENNVDLTSMLESIGISITTEANSGQGLVKIANSILEFSLLPEDYFFQEELWIRVVVDVGTSLSKILILNYSNNAFVFDLDDITLLPVMRVPFPAQDPIASSPPSSPPPLPPPPLSPPPPSPPPPLSPPPPSPLPPLSPPPLADIIPAWIIEEVEQDFDLESHWAVQNCLIQPECQLVSASTLNFESPIIAMEDFNITTAYDTLKKGVSLILPNDGPPILVLVGTESCDCIVGANGFRNYVVGGSGDDTIILGSKGDLVYAGDGDDFIIGGSSGDKIFGEAGKDIILSNGGNDHLFGGPGNDLLSGGDGMDSLVGGEGDDKLVSGLGKDKLEGGKGSDELFSLQVDGDVLDGGAGSDSLHFTVEDTIEHGPYPSEDSKSWAFP